MLVGAKDLRGRKLLAADGPVGKVDDLVIEPVVWTVQHVVVRLPGLLRRDRLFVPRNVIDEPANGPLGVALRLSELHRVALPWSEGRSDTGVGGAAAASAVNHATGGPEPDDADFCYATEVIGYRLSAADGDVGRIVDFIVDSATWIVLGAVTSTRVWLPGKSILLPVQWIDRIDREGRRVYTQLDGRTLRHAPRFKGVRTLDPDRIQALFPYYANPDGRS
jgi:hypothetical protein